MLLHTPRLFLRAIQLEDAPFMYDLLRSEGWLRFIGDRNIKTIEDSKAYIQGIIQKEGFDYFVIVERESNRAIGVLEKLGFVREGIIQRDGEDLMRFGWASIH